jgi:hypothetical protein
MGKRKRLNPRTPKQTEEQRLAKEVWDSILGPRCLGEWNCCTSKWKYGFLINGDDAWSQCPADRKTKCKVKFFRIPM